MGYRRIEFIMNEYGISRSFVRKLTQQNPDMLRHLGRVPLIDEEKLISVIEKGTDNRKLQTR